MANIVEEVEDDLLRIGEAYDALKGLPDTYPNEPAIVIAGYPNVGKSSFVGDVARASNEIARYPFTTEDVQIEHFDRDHIRYQVTDTPRLLDRPEDECNGIEQQAVSTLERLVNTVLFVADANGVYGYPIESRLELRDAVKACFKERDIPTLTVCNRSDRSTNMGTDIYMNVEADENVEVVLDAVVETIGFEPDIPPSRSE